MNEDKLAEKPEPQWTLDELLAWVEAKRVGRVKVGSYAR